MATEQERNGIRALAAMLKTHRVDVETGITPSLMVRNGNKRECLMQWMEQNPDSCPPFRDLAIAPNENLRVTRSSV